MHSSFISFAWLVVPTIAVLVAHFGFGVGWGDALVGAIAFIVAIIPVGFLAAWEDDQPGGFNNPMPGTDRKK